MQFALIRNRWIFSIILTVLLTLGMMPQIVLAEDAETVKNGYYQDGQWVEGELNQTLPDGIASVNKTAEKTGDNTYEINLEVVAEQRTATQSSEAATAIVIDRSGSMYACAECGVHLSTITSSYVHDEDCSHYSSYFWNNYVTDEQTRLAATKNAAISFLDTYKGGTTAERWVNIVSFSSDVSDSGWYNVATTAGYNDAVQAINSISARGSTDLYLGLGRANTVLSQNQVSDIPQEAKFTVVLSDGAPNRAGNTNNTQQVVANTTAQANALKEIATIYTVCFGAANDRVYAGGPTVGDFLRDNIASDSDKAFNADSTEQLNTAFEAIANEITTGLDGSGLQVVDGAAPFITAQVDDQSTSEGFTWELSDPVVSERTEGNETITVYTYTKTYTITIDANDADFVEGEWYPLNGETYLTMEDGTRVDFPVPAGQGTKSRYTVRWVDEDENLLEEDTDVIHGAMPSYDGETPTKESTAEYTYTFTGWDPEISEVTGDITYTAQYEATKNEYTVTWVNADGTELEKDEEVEYGTMPSYDGATPTLEPTAEYTYTFVGWTPEISEVTGDATYTAQYEGTKNEYTVTWVNDDGTELEKDENVRYGTMPSYNGATPTKAATAEFTYIFSGWDPEVSEVTGDITYTAQYEATKNSYTVTWVNDDGTELEKDENVEYGTMPSYDGETPTKAPTAEFTYTFSGWDPEVSEVTGDITYTAQYEATKNSYTVTWVNDDGTELEKDENVEYGTMPSYDGDTPTKSATAEFTYIFAGWNPEVSEVTGDITYTAQYDAKKNAYTVTWVDEDGTELEKDETVEYGTMPSYDGDTPTKSATAEFTYTFAGWNPEVSEVTGDITYTAQYEARKNAYTVTWVDEDGTELEKDENVEYGTMPSYDSATPTKAATAEYTYTFAGWNPEVSEVTGDITYTAMYDATKNAYTVTWVNDNGTELEKDENVEYGTMPSYDSQAPTKSSTAEYTYTFTGWNPAVSEVTGDITYTAQYEAEKNAYTVIWVNYDGTELERDNNVEYGTMPSYNGSTPSRPSTEEFTYTFTGWNPTVSPVTGDITYTAQYDDETNAYTVRWVNDDGTELEKDENVEYGTMPSYNGSTPTKPSTAEFTYTFTGWNPAVSRVTGDITYTAQYEAKINSYTVTWVNDDGTVLEKDENVEYGAMPSYDSQAPTKSSTAEFTYIFTGWNPEVSRVTGDITYTAQYEAKKNSYIVTWVDEDGTELEKDENVEYETMPSYDGSTPTKEATAEFTFTFAGWNPEVSEVVGDITYTAKYEAKKNSYTVTWVDEDGSELEKDENVEYGTMPSYDSSTPTKESTAEFTYTFAGWNPEVSEVTGDITYTAQYEAKKNSYTVTWVNDDGTELEKDENVEYGTMPSYDGETPTKAATDKYTYTFIGWNPEVSEVTGDITYTAQYEAEPVKSDTDGSNKSGKSSKGPKTGDENPLVPLAITLGVALALLGVMIKRRITDK